jgi:uncharacterized protein DUF1194
MPAHRVIGWIGLAALAVAGAAAVAAPMLRRADVPAGAAGTNVDVELVLAVDISYSMDPDEQALQREGYVAALTSPEFLNALRQGLHGKIVATYVEWAGATEQRIVVPWRVIDGRAAAEAFANEIADAPYRRAYRTSISGALEFAAPLFETSGHRGLRRVVDVSGDGANNQGTMVTLARDQLLAKGITINGLPIMLKPIGRDHGYRPSRRLLRGLRDRRARRFRDPDQGARAVQGRDPHQAGAGSGGSCPFALP